MGIDYQAITDKQYSFTKFIERGFPEYKNLLENVPKNLSKEIIGLDDKSMEGKVDNYLMMYEGIFNLNFDGVNSFDPRFRREDIDSAYKTAFRRTLSSEEFEMVKEEQDYVRACVIWSLMDYAIENCLIAEENFDASRGDK